MDSDCLVMLSDFADGPSKTTKDVHRSLGLSDKQPDKVEDIELNDYTSKPT